MEFQKTLYKQGKLQLFTSLKECPGFENYLNLPNQKLCQVITKLRITAQKFLIESGRLSIGSRLEDSTPCVVMV